MRGPARYILEETDRADGAGGAQVKQVVSSARNAYQVAGTHLDRDHVAALGRDMKKPASLYYKADLVLVVPVLLVEFIEHGVEPGRVRVHIDHIGRYVTAFGFKLFNFR